MNETPRMYTQQELHEALQLSVERTIENCRRGYIEGFEPQGTATARTLFIPPLGTKLTLAEDWTFTVYQEYRNTSLIQLMRGMPIDRSWSGYFATAKALNAGQHMHGSPIGQFTWAAGTVLTMDRIYIRKGSPDFDSVTFYAKYAVTPKKSKSVRFWAKLADVNRLRILA